jgi:hypothetical protein
MSWHVGYIGMGQPTNAALGVAGTPMAFYDSPYGIFLVQDADPTFMTAYLYTIIPSSTSITGYAVAFTGSSVTYDQTNIAPSFALSDTQIIFRDGQVTAPDRTTGIVEYGMRVLTRSGATISMSAKQQDASYYDPAFGFSGNILRVNASQFLRCNGDGPPGFAFGNPVAGTATYELFSASGATIDLLATWNYATVGLSTGDFAYAAQVGNGYLFGFYFVSPFGPYTHWALPFSTGGGPSGTATTQDDSGAFGDSLQYDLTITKPGTNDYYLYNAGFGSHAPFPVHFDGATFTYGTQSFDYLPNTSAVVPNLDNDFLSVVVRRSATNHFTLAYQRSSLSGTAQAVEVARDTAITNTPYAYLTHDPVGIAAHASARHSSDLAVTLVAITDLVSGVLGYELFAYSVAL